MLLYAITVTICFLNDPTVCLVIPGNELYPAAKVHTSCLYRKTDPEPLIILVTGKKLPEDMIIQEITCRQAQSGVSNVG